MAYITRANYKKILHKIDSKLLISEDDLEKECLCEDYPQMRLYFLNRTDKRELLLFKKVLTNPEIAIDTKYKRVDYEDTYTYVDEFRPAYHKDPQCSRLLHDFDGVRIPEKIKSLDKEKINEYRKWYRENRHYIEEGKDDLFYTLLHAKWGVDKYDIDVVSHLNTGNVRVMDTIEECYLEIVKLCKEWNDWLGDKEGGNHILRKASYQYSYGAKNAYLGNKEEPLPNNKTGFPDEAVKECLREMQNKFKNPIIELIRQYYMIKYNANIDVEEEVLKQLGFGPCVKCYSRGVILTLDVL